MIYVFEGLPGSGKTSLVNLIEAAMPSCTVLTEFLPNNDADPECIDFYLQNEHNKSHTMNDTQHQIILCDRYWISTVIYTALEQYGSAGVSVDMLKHVYETLFPNGLYNHIHYIFLQTTSEYSLHRAHIPAVPNSWLDEQFNQLASDAYDLFFEHAEILVPSLQGKILISTADEALSKNVSDCIDYICSQERKRATYE